MAKSIEQLRQELADAERQEKEAIQLQKDQEQETLRKRREELVKEASNMQAFARKEALEGNLNDSKTYQDLAKKAELEASQITLEGEESPAIREPTEEELLTEYRQESSRSNMVWFTILATVCCLLYLHFGVWIKKEYPDAGIHDWATVHKIFSVIVYLFIIELALFGMGAIRDNYLYRYADAKRYFTLDIIKDFYETTASNRLWLRFGYFALRFLGAVLLASGNLI